MKYTNLKSTLLLLFCFFLVQNMLFSQEKQLKKAALFLEQSKYPQALKASEKALKENNKSALGHMYKSIAIFNMYQDPRYAKKFKNGLKEALKNAEKAFSLEKPAVIRAAFSDYLNELLNENNLEAETYFKAQKYSKAANNYKQSLNFNPNDTLSLYLLGACYWNENQQEKAMEYYKKVAQFNFSAFADSNAAPHTYQFKAFRGIAEFFMLREQWDSAAIYLNMGLEMFPYDHILKGHRYGLYRVEVKDLPPSLDYLNKVSHILKTYPTDSFFLHKENALYIYLFKNALSHNEYHFVDSMLGIFVLDRLDRKKRENAQVIAKYDVFIGESPLQIFEKLLNYAKSNYHKDIFFWLIDKWVAEIEQKDLVSSSVFLNRAQQVFENGNTAFAALMLLSEYEKNKKVTKWNTAVFDKISLWTKQELDYLSLDYLYQITYDIQLTQKPKIKNLHKTVAYAFVDALIAENFMYKAKNILKQMLSFAPEDALFIQDVKSRKLAQADFKLNYFGSRISSFGKKPTQGETPFQLSMLYTNCESGKLSNELLQNVNQRVNYFRRTANLQNQVYFLKDRNESCQMAALLFEANKILTHKPVEGMRCFTTKAVEAAENALMVQSNNPSLAVTALMADKSESVGNRRWLLYPLAKDMGFGASPHYQVLWVMDQANLNDTATYKSSFIAWPPEGFVPKMFAFDKWSFSLFDDLNDATVKVVDAKKNTVETKILPFVDGYGMPTIVFEPQIELNPENKNDQVFWVEVVLKNKKKFNYQVRFFDPVDL